MKRQDEYNQLAAALYTTEGGRFAEHTGKAPVWFDNRDPSRSRNHNIKVAGSGEIGEIMLDFEWNDMKEKQGWAEVALPMWEKKLWNSSSAPTLRAVADVASNIASAVVAAVPGGAAVAPFVALTDDLLMAGLDYGLGYKDGMDVGKELGRKAAVTAISTYTGAKFAGMGNQVLQTATISSINTTASTAVYSTNFDSFMRGMGTFDTWKGSIASVAGAAVTAGMDRAILGEGVKDTNGKILSYTKTQGFNSVNNASIQKLTSFAGSLASSGVTYGLTGSTTFNVLDVADLGLKVNKQAVHTGLLEWTIGGDNEGLHLGSGGTNISYGTIGGALNGLSTVSVNSRINSYTKQNNLENLAVGMRMQYGYGGNAENTLLKDVLSGDTIIARGGTDGNAETVNNNGKNTVYLADYKDNMTLEEQFDLGIKLSHESYRNGINDGEIGQLLETGRAVIGHSALAQNVIDDGIYKTVMDGVIAGSTTLSNDLAELAKLREGKMSDDKNLAYLQYVNKNYDSSKDYWKLTRDGTLEYDRSGWLRDENGQIIQDENGNAIGADGVQTGLEKILNLKDSTEAVKIMHAMGLEYSKDKNGNITWGVKDSSAGTNSYNLSSNLNTRYQALDIYTQFVKESMYNTGNLDSVVQRLSFPKGSYEYSSPVDQYLAGLLDKTIERNNEIKNFNVSEYEKEVIGRIDAAIEKKILYGTGAEYENNIPTIDSTGMYCTEFASYASQKELNKNVADFIENLGLYQFDEVSPDIARSTDLIAIRGYILNSAGEKKYNNHIVEYLGIDKIAESAGDDIGVRKSRFSDVLNYYNSQNYKYDITYYRPRSYKK